jgi:hypothetical protein
MDCPKSERKRDGKLIPIKNRKQFPNENHLGGLGSQTQCEGQEKWCEFRPSHDDRFLKSPGASRNSRGSKWPSRKSSNNLSFNQNPSAFEISCASTIALKQISSTRGRSSKGCGSEKQT